jgi:hypothetical protein
VQGLSALSLRFGCPVRKADRRERAADAGTMSNDARGFRPTSIAVEACEESAFLDIVPTAD